MRTQSIAAGAGVIDRVVDPSESLSRDVTRLKRAVAEQETTTAKANEAFHAALSGNLPQERQLKLKSACDLEALRLEHLQQELQGKVSQLDFAEGQRLKFIEHQKAESEFKAATTRLEESRAAITRLQELHRDLPGKLSEATRNFNQSMHLWSEARARRDSLKGQQHSNGSN
jgi:hypothetical protein